MAHDNPPEYKPRQKRLTRRGFLAAAGLATITGGYAAHRMTHTPPLDESPLPVPTTASASVNELYALAYAALESAIPEAGNEMAEVRKKFNVLWDSMVLLSGCNVTVIPSHGHHEGAVEFTMIADPRRSDRLPALNRLFKACTDIKLLDEESGTDAPMDFTHIAKRLVNVYQERSKEAVPQWMAEEIGAMLHDVTNTGAAFVRPQPSPGSSAPEPDAARERSLSRTVSTQNVPFHFTVRNPCYPEHRKDALRINGAACANR